MRGGAGRGGAALGASAALARRCSLRPRSRGASPLAGGQPGNGRQPSASSEGAGRGRDFRFPRAPAGKRAGCFLERLRERAPCRRGCPGGFRAWPGVASPVEVEAPATAGAGGRGGARSGPAEKAEGGAGPAPLQALRQLPACPRPGRRQQNVPRPVPSLGALLTGGRSSPVPGALGGRTLGGLRCAGNVRSLPRGRPATAPVPGSGQDRPGRPGGSPPGRPPSAGERRGCRQALLQALPQPLGRFPPPTAQRSLLPLPPLASCVDSLRRRPAAQLSSQQRALLSRRGGMAGPGQLLRAGLSGLLLTGLAIILAEDPPKVGITLDLEEDLVTLHCNIAFKGGETKWEKDGYSLGKKENILQIGSALDDPRGFYTCASSGQSASLQVFFQMCQNCIQMDAATLTGLLVASMMSTVFLALAVSKIAAQEPGRLSQASDKQNLLANDQLYQPLGERSNGQYSQISLAKPRRTR